MPDDIQIASNAILPQEVNNKNGHTSDIEVKEILGNPPSWILRWGITVFFLIVMGLLGLTFLIKYPDISKASVILTSANPPITIYSKVSGKIDQFLVKDQQNIKAGELILTVESDVNYQNLISLEQAISQLQSIENDIERLKKYILPLNLELGNIQTNYGTLKSTLSSFQFFLKEGTNSKKVEGLKEEIVHIEALNQSIIRQKQLFSEEIELENKKFLRNKLLAEGRVLSQEAYEDANKALISSKRSYEQLEMSLTNNELSKERLKAQIEDLNAAQRSEMDEHKNRLDASLSIVSKEVNSWRNEYLVRATMDGKINLLKFRVKDEFVKLQDALAVIIPNQTKRTSSNNIIARAKVSESDIGKIEKGNQIMIELQGYPSKEFGEIRASLNHLSLVPEHEEDGSNYYTTDILLPSPITTNYNRSIPYQPNQTGLAKIITEDKSIASRIFKQFIDLIKNN